MMTRAHLIISKMRAAARSPAEKDLRKRQQHALNYSMGLRKVHLMAKEARHAKAP